MRTRDEHLAWAKQRALEYLDAGDQATTTYDLKKGSEMTAKLSPADAKWVAKAREDFIQRVDGKEIAALRARTAKLEAALRQSVELQSHYAELLNMHDGGQRLAFANVEAWLDRLAALKDAPQ